MIVAERKPLEKIAAALAVFRRVLVLGCRGCVAVCRVGGDAEAAALARELDHPCWFGTRRPQFTVDAMERQCERDLIDKYLRLPPGTGAILSLGCGAGVQTLADAFEDLAIVPALDTTFLGAADEAGRWLEKCKGCGDCVLEHTAGICPITRCAKSLLNGPCGGPQDGHCEVDPQVPCAWLLIHQRLSRQGRLDRILEIFPARDWRASGSEGPRGRVRRGLGPGQKVR